MMATRMDDIFGQWTWEQMERYIDTVADEQRVPRDLMRAVIKQESNSDPHAVGDNGQARGFFQLHPGAAKDAGIDPAQRHDIGLNIQAGGRYLRLKLDQAGGHVDKALQLYNGGGDPNYVANVRRWMPGGTQVASTQTQQRPTAAVWDDIFGPAPVTPQQAPQGTTPPAPVSQTGVAPGRATAAPEPPSDPVIDIEKTSPPGPAPAPAAPAGRNPSLPPGVPSIEEETLQEGITKPSTMIPLLMGGAGLKAVQGVLGHAAPWVGRLVRPVAEGVSQTLGWGTGRTIETGQVPSASELATEAGWNIAIGGALEGLGAVRQTLARRSQAGKAIAQADEQSSAAYQAWQDEVEAAKQATIAKRTDLYAEAERKARAAQAEYQRKLAARDDLIRTNQQEYDAAVREAQAESSTTARHTALEEQRGAAVRQQQYQEAVTGQQQALGEARAIPGRYTPETPSWVLYEKFGDAAKGATVDMTPAKTALAEVRASRGVLPDGTPRPFPQAVESIATHLEKAEGAVSVQTIREELRRLGPLTRSQDSNVRGAAKQLYGVYADALEASPIATDLLRQANATFRKEMALQDVQEWLRPGHGIVRIDNQGRQTINVGALMTRLEKQVGDDALFRGAFTPDELATLRRDVGRLAGTPTMPRGGPPAGAAPVHLPGASADLPARLQQPPATPAMPQAPRREYLPGGVREGRMPAAPPGPPETVTPRDVLGPRPRILGRRPGDLGDVYALAEIASALGVPRAVIFGVKLATLPARQARYALAWGLTSERGRRLLEAAQRPGGQLDPRLYGMLVAIMSPEEKKAMQRETRGTR